MLTFIGVGLSIIYGVGVGYCLMWGVALSVLAILFQVHVSGRSELRFLAHSFGWPFFVPRSLYRAWKSRKN